jgi:hypothetical protein
MFGYSRRDAMNHRVVLTGDTATGIWFIMSPWQLEAVVAFNASRLAALR